MTETHRRWAALLLALLAVTAGCSGGAGGDAAPSGGESDLAAGGGDGFQGQRATAAPQATGTPVAEDASERAAAPGEYDAAQFAERQLILEGRVAVEVADFEAARANLTALAERHGGFVSDTSQEVHRLDNETWTTGRMVLRVPRDEFTTVYEAARTEGELLEAERESRDVTDQLVDLQARLENLRAERDQLRRLYERANETEDVLRVQRRLSDVQGEIERLEARQQALRQRVALSTITVRLHEPRPEPDRPVPEQWYDVPLVKAFLESVDGVVVTLRALAVAGAYALPYVVVFGVPLGAVGYVARQREGVRPLAGLRDRLRRRGDDGDGSGDEATDEAGGSDDDG